MPLYFTGAAAKKKCEEGNLFYFLTLVNVKVCEDVSIFVTQSNQNIRSVAQARKLSKKYSNQQQFIWDLNSAPTVRKRK